MLYTLPAALLASALWIHEHKKRYYIWWSCNLQTHASQKDKLSTSGVSTNWHIFGSWAYGTMWWSLVSYIQQQDSPWDL